MKRFLALAALVLGMVSCQTEPEGLDVIVGGEQDVTINVTIPETETRTTPTAGSNSAVSAFSDLIATDTYVARYIFEVYYEGNMIERQVKYVDAESTSFRVRLIPERDYQFVVWTDIVEAAGAQDGIVSNNLHYVIGETLQDITLNDTWVAMDESRDAFTATYPVLNFNGAQSINIELVRPLAKLRVVTTDCDDIWSLYKLTATHATVEYTTEHRTAFNAFTGKAAAADGEMTHIRYEIANYSTETNASRTIFSDYFFAENDVVNFIFTVYDNKGDKIKMTNFNTPINVRRNYLTTLEGNVLTDGNDIGITVNPGFGNNGENVEDYTVITSASELLAVINTNGKYEVGNNIVITANAAATSAATRATANEPTTNEPTTTTINLNGYTITVENNTGAALATVYAGNTLFLEGGNIVLAEGSNASFIKNEGNVVLTSGEINNNSDVAPVVAGTIVVNKGAELSDDMVADENKITVNEENDGWLANVLENGGTYVFTADMTASKTIVVTAEAPVVLDGNGFTLTSTATRAINVSGAQNVTIKNLNIVASGERAINVIQNSKNVTIENVTATAANYTVNVASSAPGAVVAIKNSTLNGLCTVNVASAGANVTVDGSTVNCNDNNTTEGESYAALCLNKEAVGGKIIATNSTINVTEGSDSTAGRNGAEDGVVTINGSDKDVVVTYAVITYTGSDYYYGFQTIAEAVEFAESGDTISLIRNVELAEPLTISEGKNVVLNLNGKTIGNPGDYAIENYGILTINGDGKMEGMGGIRSHAGKITINGGTYTGSSRWQDSKYQHLLKAVNTEVVINGGTFDATIGGITNAMINVSENATVTINDGEFRNVAAGEVISQFANYMFTYEKNGKLIINDGDFYGGWRFNGETATSDIYGGNFTVSYDGQSFHANSTHVLTVYGGVFSLNNGGKLNPTNHCAEGYYASKNGNYYEVKEGSLVSNAEALAAAFDKGGDIILNANITVDETVVLAEGKTVVLDLNGKTITGAFVKGSGAIIENNGTLTIVGGTIKNTEINGDAVINNTGELVLEDVNIEGAPIGTTGYPNYAVYTSGKLIVNDGTQIISDRGVLYMKNGADVTINGGEFVVTDKIGTRVLTAHVIYAYGNSSKLTINDGNFEMNIGNGGGSSVICPAGATIKVYGGNFYHKPVTDGQSGCFQNYMGSGAPVDVYGGTFNDNTVTKSGNLAEGYKAVEKDGLWTVVAE